MACGTVQRMDFEEIRRLVIVSMFADDELMHRLVLKGGNALSLVHRIGNRTSLDVDLSLEDDFEDLNEAKKRLLEVLKDRFEAAGYHLFDGRLEPKPHDPTGRPKTWGGYRVEFKLLKKEKANMIHDLETRRRQAEVVSPGEKRIFSIEISKYEYCDPKEEVEFDGYTIFVYPPALIAAEKLRAICQQMPEYELVRNKRARARDFYDIYCVVSECDFDMGSHQFRELVCHAFAAKEVPIVLVPRISEHREFHRPDWPSVVDSVSQELEEFDFYFDWLIEEIRHLHPLWDEEAPL